MSPAFVEEDLGTVVEARGYLDLRMDPILDLQGRGFIPVDPKTRCDGLSPSSCPVMSAILEVQTRVHYLGRTQSRLFLSCYAQYLLASIKVPLIHNYIYSFLFVLSLTNPSSKLVWSRLFRVDQELVCSLFLVGRGHAAPLFL